MTGIARIKKDSVFVFEWLPIISGGCLILASLCFSFWKILQLVFYGVPQRFYTELLAFVLGLLLILAKIFAIHISASKIEFQATPPEKRDEAKMDLTSARNCFYLLVAAAAVVIYAIWNSK